MFGAWIDVIGSKEVDKIITLVLANSDPQELKQYLAERFRKTLGNNAVGIEQFDEESTKLLINLIRLKHKDHSLLYSVLKTFVYHTYMVVFHNMQEDEYRLLRYKIQKITDPSAIY